ncbi:ribokinase [uncultured Roseovarius sp.]|uniref:ribokinase n=1 Tax=uncultured Roseovarius sp. TaxID=293344 RepID=UPI002618465C|nr:ribokinase [uncultured Roseovarius sp.]
MIYNLGSINADHVYRVPRLPAPGETLHTQAYDRMLGGKGANQSIAVARAGSRVMHIGAVGPEGGWLVSELEEAGVNVRHVVRNETPTGHAVVSVDALAENSIIIHAGANRALGRDDLKIALEGAGSGDWLMMQNETNLQFEAARMARLKGLRVVYSAAPFDAQALLKVSPFLTLLVVNEIEAAQIESDLGKLTVPSMIVTRGGNGAEWCDTATGKRISVSAPTVDAMDTTGAGDTFTGYLVEALARGASAKDAIFRAVSAAAISVTRAGASEAIPTAVEVDRFISAQD